MGRRIGSYTVTGTIGRGGYGEVLAAVHDVIGRDVAIKVLHAKWSDDPEAVRRFVAEAQAVNAVRHPNIVDIVDFGTLEDGRHYHVMERLRGESLRSRLDARGSLPLDESIPILQAVAAALDAAHDAAIVHRDIKPENIFLHQDGDREQVKLIDFGLAKLANQDTAPTQTGVIMGTPAYMAPEQCRGLRVDHLTDSYAFGVLTYEVLTGEVPLKAADPVATLLLHVHDVPVPLSKAAAFPRVMDGVVMPLLAKSPASRPARLGPVVDALARCERRSIRTRLPTLWIALGIAILTGGWLVLDLSRRDASPHAATRAPSPSPAASPAPVPMATPSAVAPTASVDAGSAPADAARTHPRRLSPEAPENPYR